MCSQTARSPVSVKPLTYDHTTYSWYKKDMALNLNMGIYWGLTCFWRQPLEALGGIEIFNTSTKVKVKGPHKFNTYHWNPAWMVKQWVLWVMKNATFKTHCSKCFILSLILDFKMIYFMLDLQKKFIKYFIIFGTLQKTICCFSFYLVCDCKWILALIIIGSCVLWLTAHLSALMHLWSYNDLHAWTVLSCQQPHCGAGWSGSRAKKGSSV